MSNVKTKSKKGTQRTSEKSASIQNTAANEGMKSKTENSVVLKDTEEKDEIKSNPECSVTIKNTEEKENEKKTIKSFFSKKTTKTNDKSKNNEDTVDSIKNTEDIKEDVSSITAKPSETKPSETKPSETKPSETKPSETKPVETKPAETKPVETKPATASAAVKPTETQPVPNSVSEPEQPTKSPSIQSEELKKNFFGFTKKTDKKADTDVEEGEKKSSAKKTEKAKDNKKEISDNPFAKTKKTKSKQAKSLAVADAGGKLAVAKQHIPFLKKNTLKAKAKAVSKSSKKQSGLKTVFPFLSKEEDVLPPIPEYNMKRDGTLVTPEYREGDTILEAYWAIEGLCFVSIIQTAAFERIYQVDEPPLTEFEHTLLERMDDGIREILILHNIAKSENRKDILYRAMDALLREYRLYDVIKPEAVYRIRYYLERSFFGWGRIDALRCDYDLEDISCDGYGSHVFIYHRVYRDMKTTIVFDDPKELDNLVASFAQKAGKHISLANPIVDASLSDGSRIQLTYSTVVSAHGSSFTIRKFKPTPFSPIELLKKGTFTPEELAFLWIAVENGKSMMVIGGTASGKTTTLNAISQFIPKLSKVVSIEDTREITLNHENWIASVVPPESPSTEQSKNDITMFDLLKAAMRQRPEYILVGEVRGIESQTLFQAINTGHTTFSTMHASDVVSAINRLTNPPLDVPKASIQALDLVVAQARYYKDGAPYRRIKEVVEIIGMSESGGIEVNTTFAYDPGDDTTSYSGNSKVYKDIMQSKNFSHIQMQDEVKRRTKLLEAMLAQEIFDFRDVGSLIWVYRSTPELIMENIDKLGYVLTKMQELSVSE